MRKLIILFVFILVACAPPNYNQNPPPESTPAVNIVKENAGNNIVIYHDDVHNATCYTITNTIVTHYGSYGVGIDTNYTKSLSCIADMFLVNVEE